MTKILHEFSFAVIDLVPARDEQDSGADQLRHLFEIHLDKLLVQACSEDKVPVIQFLLEQGASLRRIHALENSSAMFPGMILHDETRQYLRLYSLIDAIAQDDNEYRSEALNYLKQAAVRLPTNEIGQALSSFNLIEECSIRMKKKFGELSFPVNNELILNALGKVYRFLTGNQDGNAVRQYLTRASDDLVLAAAVSAVERNAANQLDEIMKAFPDVTRIALRDGTTLLHIAAQYPNSGIVKLLLEAGCDPDQARSDDLTPEKSLHRMGSLIFHRHRLSHSDGVRASGFQMSLFNSIAPGGFHIILA